MPLVGIWIAPALDMMTVATLRRAYGTYMGEQVGIYGGVFIAWLASMAIGNLVALVLSLSAVSFTFCVARVIPSFKDQVAQHHWLVGLILPIPFLVVWLLHGWTIIGPPLVAPLLAAALLISPWFVVVGTSFMARGRMQQ